MATKKAAFLLVLLLSLWVRVRCPSTILYCPFWLFGWPIFPLCPSSRSGWHKICKFASLTFHSIASNRVEGRTGALGCDLFERINHSLCLLRCQFTSLPPPGWLGLFYASIAIINRTKHRFHPSSHTRIHIAPLIIVFIIKNICFPGPAGRLCVVGNRKESFRTAAPLCDFDSHPYSSCRRYCHSQLRWCAAWSTSGCDGNSFECTGTIRSLHTLPRAPLGKFCVTRTATKRKGAVYASMSW